MPLLSENAFLMIQNNSQNSPLFSSLGKTEESLSAITEVLHSRDNFYHKKGRSLNTNRYNSQTMWTEKSGRKKVVNSRKITETSVCLVKVPQV